MKKFLKWAGIVAGSLFLLVFIAIRMASEPLPEGERGTEAEALAQKLWTATHQEAWDSTRYVRWNYDGRRHFVWDRDSHLVQVTWASYKVLLNTQDQQGPAWKNGSLLEGKKAERARAEAWKIFCNDSFWLNAPGKIFDPGTSRAAVTLEDGSKGLLVSYSSGGVTPGDSYLWIMDENGLPRKWKMWVSILPIGGAEASWEDWRPLPTGALVATTRVLGPILLHVNELEAGNSWESIGLTADPFETLR